MGRSPHPPLCGPSSARGLSRRNFRKHLRMVGSRRVKAQSKMGAGEVGSAVRGSLGLGGELGLCMLAVHLPRGGLAPQTRGHHPPAVFCCPPRGPCPLPCFLLPSVCPCFHVLSGFPNSVPPHPGPSCPVPEPSALPRPGSTPGLLGSPHRACVSTLTSSRRDSALSILCSYMNRPQPCGALSASASPHTPAPRPRASLLCPCPLWLMGVLLSLQRSPSGANGASAGPGATPPL